MAKRIWTCLAVAFLAAVIPCLVSCSSSAPAGGSAQAPHQIKYRCLSSSCDAVVVCNEGDPVPMHCGKPMIK